MDLRKVVLKIASSRATFSTNDVLNELNNKFTRAYVLRFIDDLIAEGRLFKSGSTRSAIYALAENQSALRDVFNKRYKNKDLKEHEVLEELKRRLRFLRHAPEHIQSIFSYAFSEMLNNAIDHSKSGNIAISVNKRGKIIEFVVDDFGIGVFNNIMKKRNLFSPLEAVQDLLKGKTTTVPHAHSGEGIFFTSKVADVFILESYGCQLKIDNLVDDVFVNDLKPSKSGTRVIFELSFDHAGHLDDVFRQYYTDIENLAFDKTEVRIKLFTRGSIYVSRSQAKRVLAGLEKFRTVILDFNQVSGVGQAFADEIFRVFPSKHPGIRLIPENMNEAVRFMVERVEKF